MPAPPTPTTMLIALKNTAFNLIRPAETQSLSVNGDAPAGNVQIHLFMVTLDCSMITRMARIASGRVETYTGARHLSFHPSRPVIRLHVLGSATRRPST